MKTSLKLLLGLGAIVALALTASAFDQLKGGQVQISQTPVPVRLSTDASAEPVAMACPKCQDIHGISSTPLGRGAYVKTGTYTQHVCGGCQTTASMTGMGRAKTTTTTHTCELAKEMATCCASK